MTLFEKRRKVAGKEFYWAYPEEDVKEFLRSLKINMELTYDNGCVIDKLAGEELT